VTLEKPLNLPDLDSSSLKSTQQYLLQTTSRRQHKETDESKGRQSSQIQNRTNLPESHLNLLLLELEQLLHYKKFI
jgi:hypothetical protein